MDIVFCGGEIAGNFAKEVARSRRMSFDFLFTRRLAEVLDYALEETPCNLLIDLDYVEEVRQQLPLLKHRRTDLYELRRV